MPPPAVCADDKKQDENPRIPGQGNLQEVRRPHASRLPVLLGRRGRRGGEEARRQRLGGEGADPCRRPRQGRRRESREVSGRSTRLVEKNIGHEPCYPSNGASRPEGQTSPDRGGRR